jgi:hypothetical protein
MCARDSAGRAISCSAAAYCEAASGFIGSTPAQPGTMLSITMNVARIASAIA